jgi:hypothetical protein
MPVVADQLQHRIEEIAADSQNDGLTQPGDKQQSLNSPPEAPTHGSSKVWAIGGAAAIALVALATLNVYRKPAPAHDQDPLKMALVKPQEGASSQRFASSAKQPQSMALRAQGASEMPGLQSRQIPPDRSTLAANSQAPIIARTASLTSLVKDFAVARASLDSVLARYGGYTANLTIDTPENGQRHFNASLRIPVGRLNPAMADLKMLGRTLNESQSGEEVTQQHADLIARLQNSRETEQRLRSIIQQRTGKIDDVLQVEEEIARVRGEIESMESEQRTLEHRVDFASVDLQLVEDYKEQFNTSPTSASSRLHNALVEGMRNASGTLLGLALILEEFGPAIVIWSVIFGLPAYLISRRYRKSRTTA